MANVFNAAKYILEQCGPLSTMKLQKLCYYSQAWSLVWDDDELFPEDFQAWANGPVCRELYDSHAGEYKISAMHIPSRKMDGELTENQKDTINRVLDFYGSKDAQWLSTLTHMEAPWKDTREGYAPGARCDRVISKASMAEYYGSL